MLEAYNAFYGEGGAWRLDDKRTTEPVEAHVKKRHELFERGQAGLTGQMAAISLGTTLATFLEWESKISFFHQNLKNFKF